MNPITLDAIKLLLDIQHLEAVSDENKQLSLNMVTKLLNWMNSDIDAVVAKTSKLLNP